MSDGEQLFFGPMRWHKAIAAAQLDAYEKSVMRSLIDWIKWPRKGEVFDPTPELWPSVQSIADSAGLRSRKGTQLVLKRLRKKGLIEFVDKRTGGRSEHGKPNTSRIRLNFDRLDEIKREQATRSQVRTGFCQV